MFRNKINSINGFTLGK